jgi:hypothetical protein
MRRFLKQLHPLPGNNLKVLEQDKDQGTLLLQVEHRLQEDLS